MEKKHRRKFSAEFMAKVVLEALKECQEEERDIDIGIGRSPKR